MNLAIRPAIFTALALAALLPSVLFAQSGKPDVVLVLMDNYGWGEPGVYGGGIIRGAPSPRIDKLAAEGMRLLNFNVEAQCTPSRAAIMTGRYAIRTGNATIPIETPVYGLTQWEYTLAEMFSDVGYATGMFGKWHLGHTKGRFPTDQGFDEWYGIPNSSDESAWPDDSRYRRDSHAFAQATYIMEGRKGKQPEKLHVYDTEQRILIDAELTRRSVDFMQRQTRRNKPFFLFVPLTMPHMPTLPHAAFKGKTGNGDFADVLVQTDAYVGQMLDAIDRLGIRDDTIFIFTSDNGPDPTFPHTSFSGPWRGSYFTAWEGSLRVPFIARWPGNIPAGSVSNEIVHQMDLFPTLARVAGGRVPADRVIDGVDQLEFLMGRQRASNREHVIVYVGNQIFGIKWRNYEMMMKEIDLAFGSPTRTYDVPLFFDLHTDPKEESPIHSRFYEIGWIRWPMSDYLVGHAASLQKGTADSAGNARSIRTRRLVVS